MKKVLVGLLMIFSLMIGARRTVVAELFTNVG